MRTKWLVAVLILGCAISSLALEVQLPESAGDVRLQVYGYIRADLSYGTQATAPGTDFAFWVLPEIDGKKDGQTHVGARETRFGLALFGPNAGHWKTFGKIEMDFYGGDKANAYNPRMRLAFVDVAHTSGFSFRLGQDWDTFMELQPRIVNFASVADVGALGLRRPQGRVTQEWKCSENTKLVFKAALAQTVGEDLDQGGFEDGADAEWPSFQFNVTLHQKLWTEKMARFSVAGHYGRETLDGTEKVVATNASGVVAERVKIISSDVEDFDTWSIQGSIFLPLTGQLAAQVNLWQGENLDTYYGGIGQGVNMALRKGVRAVGGYAQLLFDPCAKWGFALGYGVDDPDNDTLSPGMRSRNECIWGNAAYHFTPALTGMLEYSHMTTDYHEKSDATNDRVQVAMKYAF
ncbi:MAG: hypothetical protein WAQ74_02715 [Kiritimatiellia bacterium]|jgi:hypothetical protein|nr:hypothetical protein [Lentisphaerota bacterium]